MLTSVPYDERQLDTCNGGAVGIDLTAVAPVPLNPTTVHVLSLTHGVVALTQKVMAACRDVDRCNDVLGSCG